MPRQVLLQVQPRGGFAKPSRSGFGWADPWSIGAGLSALLAMALLAAWVPARRAARIHPMEALRCD